jgi:ammonia channel protein AmtB
VGVGNVFLYNLGQYFGLSGYGVRDFAGGTVVHAYAGLAGAVAPWLPGLSMAKRAKANGKYLIPAYKEAAEYCRSELPYAIVGTTLLFFGWFGFNGGGLSRRPCVAPPGQKGRGALEPGSHYRRNNRRLGHDNPLAGFV